VTEFSQFDNTAVIEILALRLEEVKLLGLNNFGEVSVVAKWPSRLVVTFCLRDLAQRARPYAERRDHRPA
jgi:Zn-dependent oligopeptidase